MEDKSTELLLQFISRSGYSIDSTELNYQYKSSPYYPSLRAITGVLKHFDVEHLAAKVERSSQSLHQLPNTFIAHLNDDRFVLVQKGKERLRVLFDDASKKQMDYDIFLEFWDGVVLVIEEDMGKGGFQKTRAVQFQVILLFLIILGLIVSINGTLFAGLHSLASLLGCAIAFLIVKHEAGESSLLINSICNGAGERLNCSDVLKSKGAVLFGKYTLGHIGLSYFSMLTLGWIFISLYNLSTSAVIQLTLAVIPFTIYSVLYQLWVVKKWCLLCLSIVVTIWMSVAVVLFFTKPAEIVTFDLKLLLGYVVLYVVSFLTTGLWLSNTQRKREYNELKIKSKRFKQKVSVYNSLIQGSKQVATKISSAEISLGDKNSPLETVIVTSPFCRYCKEVHLIVEQILKAKLPVKVILRFNVKDTTGDAARVTGRIVEIYFREGEEKCLDALRDIYQLNLKKWRAKYGSIKDNYFIETIVEERAWCERNGITFTPEILINGMIFPKDYDREDLPDVLESLSEGIN